MTKEFITRMSYEQLEQAYYAYSKLACIYEEVCQGPYSARAYKEYFAVMDSRENIRRRVEELAIIRSHGEK